MRFTIQQLSQYSGIKSHTIRMWEKRYQALKPNRSRGNVRYYDHEQLKKLLNIVNLLKVNYKISTICNMSQRQLLKINDQFLNDEKNNFTCYSNQLLEAGMFLQEESFQDIYNKSVNKFGFLNTYLQVIYPMLHKIGLLWLNEKIPAIQEHFISHLIRSNILNAIYNLPTPTNTEYPWVLFLPANEYHEIGLLMTYYLLKQKGYMVYYLGANVSFDCLDNISKLKGRLHMLCFLVQTVYLKQWNIELKKYIKKNHHIYMYIIGNEDILKQITLSPTMRFYSTLHSFHSSI